MRTVLNFSRSEVIAYLEDLILNNEADSDEMDMYIEYKWNNKLNKHTYEELVKKMKKDWKEVY